MQDAEEEALAAPVAAPEHDVAVYSPRYVNVDLDVVRGALVEESLERGDEVGVARTSPSARFRAGAEEGVPGCGPPSVWDSFPGPLDDFGAFGVEVEDHAAAVSVAFYKLAHFSPFLFSLPFTTFEFIGSSAVFFVFGNVGESGRERQHVACVVDTATVFVVGK